MLGLGLIAAESASFGEAVPWVPHPEIWLLVAGAVVIGAYSAKVLQPKAIAAGYPALTKRQKTWFGVGVLGIWLVSDWPMHDIAEDHLYAVHMFQHLMLSMVLPGIFILAMPRWVFELLVVPESALWRIIRTLSRPIVAGLIFNGLTLWLHWSRIVQLSADSAGSHFGFHLMVFSAGLLMWMPVISPITEWRLAPLGQCIFLFSMSIVPTVPGGWLVFAQGVVYRHYDTAERLWGVDVLSDQQAAGVVMKLFGGFFLWAVIVVIFGRWARSEGEIDRKAIIARHNLAPASDNLAPASESLTYQEVSEAFAASPAPTEPRAKQ